MHASAKDNVVANTITYKDVSSNPGRQIQKQRKNLTNRPLVAYFKLDISIKLPQKSLWLEQKWIVDRTPAKAVSDSSESGFGQKEIWAPAATDSSKSAWIKILKSRSGKGTLKIRKGSEHLWHTSITAVVGICGPVYNALLFIKT